MTLASKIGLSLAGLGAVAGGGLLWAQFGRLVYFDIIAAAFVACFI